MQGQSQEFHHSDLLVYCPLFTVQKQPQKGVLKNSAKLTGKQTLAQVFSMEFCETSTNNFFTEHLWTAASDGN